MSSLPPEDIASSGGSIFSPELRALTIGVIAIDSVNAFEATGVVTAMPVAVRELGGLPLFAWTFTSFVATFLFANVIAGEWADRFGPVRPLLIGSATFALGTLVAGFAPGMNIFLAGRAVQGLGSGAVIVAVYVLIGRAFPEQMRPRMFTALSGAWIIPGLLGPAIAGVFADTLSWRWLFFAVFILMIPIAVLLVPQMTRLDLPGDPDYRPERSRIRLAAMAAIGTALIQFSGQRLNLWSIPTLALALALVALSVPRLLPRGTLRLRRGLPTVIAERGLLAGAFFASEAFIPLLLVEGRGLASAVAGITISSSAVGWFIGSWYQGRPTTRRTRESLVRLGSLMVCVGIVLTTLVVVPAVPPVVTIATWGVAAFGMGTVYGSLSVLLLDLSAVADQGVNAAGLQVADSVGAIVSTGIAGAIFAAGHSDTGTESVVYISIFAVTAALAAAATLVAGRVTPRSGLAHA